VPPTEPPLLSLVPHTGDVQAKYEKICQIGEGTYGKVFKAKNLTTGSLVAMKKVRMETEKEGFPITATREINILSSIDHPNIISLNEIVTSKGTFTKLMLSYFQHIISFHYMGEIC